MSGESHPDYIKESQRAWGERKQKDPVPSFELTKFAPMIDASIRRTFGQYIPEDQPVPSYYFSVLANLPTDDYTLYLNLDNTRGSEKFIYSTGIGQINEWMTDFAASYWLSHEADKIGAEKLAKLYTQFLRLFTNTHMQLGYGIMENIRGRNDAEMFADHVFQAYFAHTFDPINEDIRRANIEGCKDITELAVYIGKDFFTQRGKQPLSLTKNTPAPDPQNVPDALEMAKMNIRDRIELSMKVGGHQSQSGVIEIPLLRVFLTNALAPLHASLIPYFVAHETIHAYSDNVPEFHGIQPIRVYDEEEPDHED